MIMNTKSNNFLKLALSILLLSNSVLVFYILKQEKNQQKQNSELNNVIDKLDAVIKNNFENQSKKPICLNLFIENDKIQELNPVTIKYIEEIIDIVTEVEAIEAPINQENEYTDCRSGIFGTEAIPEKGMQSFYDYIKKNINYPISAKSKNIEGEVIVSFVINKKGEITEVEAKNDIGGGCKEEAERVIKNSSTWNPAKWRGKIVKTRLTIPIVFKLENN